MVRAVEAVRGIVRTNMAHEASGMSIGRHEFDKKCYLTVQVDISSM